MLRGNGVMHPIERFAINSHFIFATYTSPAGAQTKGLATSRQQGRAWRRSIESNG